MLEAIAVDADGQLLTGSFMDYAMPRADDLPPGSACRIPHPQPGQPAGRAGRGRGLDHGGARRADQTRSRMPSGRRERRRRRCRSAHPASGTR